ncbi:MAG: glycosyltransferase family 4 protein [Granulosicoccus sp.]
MRVVFVQKFVPHYRLPFFERLRSELAARDIGFELIYGPPDPYEKSKVRMEFPEWGRQVNSRIVKIAGRYLYWQGAIKHVRRNDLVVVEHAAKLIDNYLLYAASRLGYIHYSYFGHGENFQTKHELGVSRAVKKAMLRKVSRWFAYTEISRQSLLRQEVDDTLITVVNNTLKTPDLGEVSFEKTANQFLYIGGLYADKRLDLMLDAATRVAAQVEDFKLHVVGEGPLQHEIESAAVNSPWLRYHGALYGVERDKMLASSQAILMPGLVGLVAIDSFHFRCPVITSDVGQHSPEIAYLERDVNALIDSKAGNAETYAQLMLRFVQEPGLAERLQSACADSAGRYTIENMVENFIAGVTEVYAEARNH